MCCTKCSKCIKFLILPFSILVIFLFQIYAQYSTLMCVRTKMDSIKDGRKTMTNYQFRDNIQYDFNIKKVEEYFDDNALMNIKFLKNQTFKIFDYINNKKEEKVDDRIYMFYYLIIYDVICIIIVYFFVYESVKAGLIKIILQSIRFYFNAKRLYQFNSRMDLFSIIKSKFENMYYFREWELFNPEAFLIIEFLCNFVIILDIIYLIILICNKRRAKRIKIIQEVMEENESDTNNVNNKDEKEETGNGNESEKIVSEINNVDSNEEDSHGNGESSVNEKDKKSKDTGTLQIFEENEEDEEDVNISDESEHNGETKK